MFLFLIIGTCANIYLCANVERVVELDPTQTYSNFLTVDDEFPDLYKLYWSFTDKDITFEIHCQTLGWVGLGLSPNGGMTGADIAIGWVSNGKALIQDTYATYNGRPKVDGKQDWQLINGYEKDGITVLKMKRDLDTCDTSGEDRVIKKGTVYLIFAWNSQDPVNGVWAYHGPLNRRSKQVILLNYRTQSIDDQAQLPGDTVNFDFRMKNVTVPPQETFYYCDVFEFPKIDKKMHLIQFDVLINSLNKRNFHHLLGFECDEDFKPTKPLAQECGEKGLPEDVGKYCMSRLMFAWAIGGDVSYKFPKVAGYPWIPSNRTRYFLLEFHYDNPELKSDITDDSGVRLFLTPSLRQHDLGVLQLSNALLQIPPLSDDIKMTAVCPSECTNKYLPKEGITVLTGLLHTHLVGKSVRTYVVREGKIVKNLIDNPSYDFNYQYAMDIEPYTLQRGDQLYTECVYSTKSRSKYTTFGYGTQDEMCMDFLYYYPRMIEMPTCASFTNIKSVYEFFTLLMKDKLIPNYELPDSLDDFSRFWGTVLETEKTLRNNVTFSSDLIKRFMNFIEQKHNITYFCGEYYLDKVSEGPFKELNDESSQCKSDSFANRQTWTMTVGLLTILVYIFN